MRRMLIVLVLTGSASPLAAQGFFDPGTRFSARPPAGVVMQPASNAKFDFSIGFDSATGAPPKAGSSQNLCQAGFKASPANAALSQAAINQAIRRKDWQDVAAEVIGSTFDIDASQVVSLGKISGIEYQLRPKFGPGHEDVRQMLTIAETPRGRTSIVCATSRQGWPRALRLFRAIRAGITPP